MESDAVIAAAAKALTAAEDDYKVHTLLREKNQYGEGGLLEKARNIEALREALRVASR